MGIPQILIIIWFTTTLTLFAVKHGEPQPSYNFWSSLLAVAGLFGLLYWGGFFS